MTAHQPPPTNGSTGNRSVDQLPGTTIYPSASLGEAPAAPTMPSTPVSQHPTAAQAELSAPQPPPEVLAPRIDLIETSDELVIFVELPGYSEDDIVLEGLDQQVRISAERTEQEVEDGRHHVQERPTRVERTVFLPTAVDIENADATFEEGVCRIEIPKLEEMRTHQIGFH